MIVRIWSADNGDEEDAREIEVVNKEGVEDAVERFARRDWGESDYWERAEFRCAYDGKVRRFVVTAERTVEFNMREEK